MKRRRKPYFQRWGVRRNIERQIDVLCEKYIQGDYKYSKVANFIDAANALRMRRYSPKRWAQR